jgi:hypothetical protein
MKSFIEEGVDYMNERIKCPVCGKTQFSYANSYEIFPVCMWENEEFALNNPDEESGANKLSLNQYREKWHIESKNER